MSRYLHPADILKAVYMEPLNLNKAKLAKALDVSESSISRLLNKKSNLSVEMALRLEKCFGRSAESWMIQQMNYSLSLKHMMDLDSVKLLYQPKVISDN